MSRQYDNGYNFEDGPDYGYGGGDDGYYGGRPQGNEISYASLLAYTSMQVSNSVRMQFVDSCSFMMVSVVSVMVSAVSNGEERRRTRGEGGIEKKKINVVAGRACCACYLRFGIPEDRV
jgi:hypothetical protein